MAADAGDYHLICFVEFQIIEMLEAFSTSPDKSMSLGDFEKMMIAAKLA